MCQMALSPLTRPLCRGLFHSALRDCGERSGNRDAGVGHLTQDRLTHVGWLPADKRVVQAIKDQGILHFASTHLAMTWLAPG